ncbi:GAF and ANTAR domain-containing protein [Mycobacterium yunnanensis]|uniref:GAF and ANTAR domain-containing protein n=1 Tax=Mycobacterium yunnanensis TaxID=368477 RepID=A0A9X2Z1W5_9MYCO|nr:GAF and ANTAR domain-containing protein [Mycobacterium yunnanensis]
MSSNRTVGDELAAVHARLAGILLTEQTVHSALQLIISLARDTLPGSVGAGVTLMRRDGRPATSAATDPEVEALDRLQHGLEEGPCLTAWATSSVVRVDDLTTEDRWPVWSPRAAAIGMRSVLSAPMEAGGTTWGAVKVYGAAPNCYDERSAEVLRRFGAQAAIFTANVQTAEATQRLSDDLTDTLHSRDVIAVARGMVMARRGMDSERAYRQLVQLARQSRIPLTELAERMVASPVRRDAAPDR